MNKIKLIYNPVAGNGTFPEYLDDFIKKFQKYYELNIFRSNDEGHLVKGLQNISPEEFHYIIVAGGDGTVNKIVNTMLKRNIQLPLGIIPTGTVNDFAYYLGMPTDINRCFDIILKQNFKKVDVGNINNLYFLNVCVGGLFSDIPHSTDNKFKNKLGRLAYYLKGIQDFTGIETFPVRITTSEKIIEEDIIMFLVLNTRRAGGFKNLAPRAEIDDGLFDLIVLKAGKFYQIPNLLFKLFQQNLLDYDDILYLQSDYFKIEILDSRKKHFSDIDGEKGPAFPLEISVKENKFTFIKN